MCLADVPFDITLAFPKLDRIAFPAGDAFVLNVKVHEVETLGSTVETLRAFSKMCKPNDVD